MIQVLLSNGFCPPEYVEVCENSHTVEEGIRMLQKWMHEDEQVLVTMMWHGKGYTIRVYDQYGEKMDPFARVYDEGFHG